jgi:hypothetical protein
MSKIVSLGEEQAAWQAFSDSALAAEAREDKPLPQEIISNLEGAGQTIESAAHGTVAVFSSTARAAAAETSELGTAAKQGAGRLEEVAAKDASEGAMMVAETARAAGQRVATAVEERRRDAVGALRGAGATVEAGVGAAVQRMRSGNEKEA